MGVGNSAEILIAPDYIPSKDEEYMNPQMLRYFKKQLLEWREELIQQSRQTIQLLQKETQKEPDLNDRASIETDRSLELRARDRNRKLIAKIDEALIRIQEGEYGYCEDTGAPIGIARLLARPIATLSIEAQERHEKAERVHVDYRV